MPGTSVGNVKVEDTLVIIVKSERFKAPFLR
jgi:hypothetical protein